MKIFVAGLSYKTTPVEVREKLAVQRARLQCCGCRLKLRGGLAEVVLLSTCNRVEIYGVSPWIHGRVQQLFQELTGSDFDFTPHLYVKEGAEAAKHLFAVASGLDSLVIGETEITGQVKNAYQAAKDAGLVGKKMNRLFQTAFAVVKAVRTQPATACRATLTRRWRNARMFFFTTVMTWKRSFARTPKTAHRNWRFARGSSPNTRRNSWPASTRRSRNATKEWSRLRAVGRWARGHDDKFTAEKSTNKTKTMKMKNPYWKMSACLAAAGLTLLGSLTAAQAAAPALSGSLTLRPLTPTEIKTYGITGSNAQFSAGCKTVALGEPVYIDAMVNAAIAPSNIVGVAWTLATSNKPAGARAALSPSPLNNSVPLYNTSDRYAGESATPAYQLADRAYFRPDAVGPYTVRATITTVGSGSTNLSVTITAATYLGLQTCAACHSGHFSEAPSIFNTYTNTQ